MGNNRGRRARDKQPPPLSLDDFAAAKAGKGSGKRDVRPKSQSRPNGPAKPSQRDRSATRQAGKLVRASPNGIAGEDVKGSGLKPFGAKRKVDARDEDEDDLTANGKVALKPGSAKKGKSPAVSVSEPSQKKQKVTLNGFPAVKVSASRVANGNGVSRGASQHVTEEDEEGDETPDELLDGGEITNDEDDDEGSEDGDISAAAGDIVVESFDDWAAEDGLVDDENGDGRSEEEDDEDAGEQLDDAEGAGLEMGSDLEDVTANDEDQSDDDEEEDSQNEEEGGENSATPDDDITLHLIDEDADEESRHQVPSDVVGVKQQVQEVVRILGDFKNLARGVPRTTYMSTLTHLLASYFSYTPYLVSILVPIFPLSEILPFFEANESPRPVTIRTNTLKTTRRELVQKLEGRGVKVGPVGGWEKSGLVVFESKVPIGATPEYLAGHYLLQSPSSFLPVLALAPQEHERVLDMCAAPGGKSTHMAALMRNTGSIVVNDANRGRCKGLVANIQRMGVRNAIVSNYDAREYPKVLGGFDRVLLDAPCSGTGVISKDQSVKINKTEKDFQKLSALQKELILRAIDSCDAHSKTGGCIVYSTCSVTVQENEEVVNYALTKRDVKLVDTELEFGKEGFVNFCGKSFHPSLKLTRRYYPHTNNMDGFFVAKFKKLSNRVPPRTHGDEAEAEPGDGTSEKRTKSKGKKQAEKETVKGSAKAVTKSQEISFDDDADAELIKAAKLKHLKKKGVKVNQPKDS